MLLLVFSILLGLANFLLGYYSDPINYVSIGLAFCLFVLALTQTYVLINDKKSS